MDANLKDFILMLADNNMILGQRLGEWCGHGPVLEQDIALTNIALDLIGEARTYYQYLAEKEGKAEDDYPMLRSERAFKNVLLVEQPNGHWGQTIVRQFLFDCWHYFHLEAMVESKDATLAAIAEKSIKEARYHLTFSGEWMIRLGDGTEESHEKMQASLNDLMPFFDEMFDPASYEVACINQQISPDLSSIHSKAIAKVQSVVSEATLDLPTDYFARKGGKTGLHSEYLGHILSEMQYLQRAYPGATW
ncbi:MAG: phenylacetate-CoA oxygenase subunit PaaC [Chitinophagales bacterium]|nr:phenylacetate-CoA oxygenase subunit PaaC [Chitinophagales bacterium]